MRKHKRVGAAGLAAALVLGLGQPGWATPGGGSGVDRGAAVPVGAADQAVTVTLVTGDGSPAIGAAG
ncbi:hypothetical protein [Micromonospora radicis]|uniref:hypothetical protein n=1 Tax=Micromonospora radicis TaxID=1894971 RepID=UPI0011C3A924|nr:hypothetical protein [Micromonospora radicis]